MSEERDIYHDEKGRWIGDELLAEYEEAKNDYESKRKTMSSFKNYLEWLEADINTQKHIVIHANEILSTLDKSHKYNFNWIEVLHDLESKIAEIFLETTYNSGNRGKQ